jgi:hypothetical protein
MSGNRLGQAVIHELRDIVRAEGVSGLARWSIALAYRQGVRPFIPGEPVQYAGIPICHDRKWSDRLVPMTWIPNDAHADQPGYEAALVAGLRETVRSGDNVVIVGAGLGVTAVVAALLAGPLGTVRCFEGSKRHVRYSQQTAARNKLTNISVRHAVVGKSVKVYGSDVGIVVPVSQLPQCDVLELDCEGAEVEILRGLTIQPRVILVETHGQFGAPTDLVGSLLEKHGYVVFDRGLAEPLRGAHECAENDVRVLLGTLQVMQWNQNCNQRADRDDSGTPNCAHPAA